MAEFNDMTPASPPSAPASTPSGDLATDYSNAMADGDFVQEFREGQNSAKYMTPDQVRQLVDLKNEEADRAARRSTGIFRRIVD